ncbi:anthranilate phosphoribosyltransferase [Ghiorsea bivora]|uniref:anthranilate phosphoribosyltransferase n=1 Tax=Ghiorsea bivora TaxID=1485545 RepID=UPI00056F5D58|nr:anthranilate phosphoribosyltransferase [Ghiorsea bivora]
MEVASLIKRVARGKHGSEHLNQDEARFVFSELLNPQADALQLGAFLIAQRMKGETSAELAGFVQAAREHVSHFNHTIAPQGTVDLPCYAGKRRAAHAYLIAALEAKDKGIPIFVHGISHIEGRVTAWQVLQTVGIKAATTLSEAKNIMDEHGMVYMDLEDICPDLNRIYHLRDRLGVRSFVNTVARLLNPMQCDKQLNGFFHTPYADYMAEANVLLGQKESLVFMGAEGEPELYADRQKVVKHQTGNTIESIAFEDSGCETYPKQAVEDLQQIYDDFQRMLNGNRTEREQATVERVKQVIFSLNSHLVIAV